MLLNELKNLYLGSQSVSKVYLGEKLIYQKYSQKLQAIINSANINNISLPNDLTKIDKFISDLGLVWNKLDVLYLLASTDASRDVNFNRIDFIKPTRLGTYNGGLSYGLGGIKGNGTNAYFGTSFNPAVDGLNYTLNNASRGVFVSSKPVGTTTSLRTIDGNLTVGNNIIIMSESSTGIKINQGNTENANAFDILREGLLIANRLNSVSLTILTDYKQYNTTATSISIQDQEQYILRRGTGYGDAQIGLYFMGASLTLEDYNIINNAYNNYIL